jgi:hypothetical protein
MAGEAEGAPMPGVGDERSPWAVVAILTGLSVLACGSYDGERVRDEADAFARSYLAAVDTASSRAADFLDREFFPTDPPWGLLGAVNAELGELGSLELEAATGTTGLNRSGEMFVTLDYQAMYANGPSAVKVTLRRASSDSPWFVRGNMVSYESMAIELAEETGRFLEGYFASVAGRDFDTALSLYSESFLREHPADKWRASLAATRDTLGRPGDRTLIELDVWGSVLTGATIIDLGYSVEYERLPAIERFTVFRISRDQRAEIHHHEISTDPAEAVPANR